MRFLRLSSFLALVTVSACDSSGNGAPDGGLSGSRARFEPAAAPIDFGAIPFPDDLYLEDGRVSLGAFPSEALADPTTVASLRESLRELDGFGVVSPVFFFFDAALDPSSLPASPGASSTEDASVFLVDADPASPSLFERIPVVVRWDTAALRLSLQPMDGHPLAPGRRYAAVVTSAVMAADGGIVAPALRFAEVRDAASRPEDPIAAAAYDEYSPVLASLATNGVPRESVVALAVFTVQTITPPLEDARDAMRAAPIPAIEIRRVSGITDLDALLGVPAMDVPGSDVEGGVLHSHIAWVIDGTFATSELASPSPGVHGAWTIDAEGAPIVRRADEAWFTLLLPTDTDLASVPVIVYQHGLGGQRGDVFAVADTLCAQGFAVAAIDIPFHGMRLTGGSIDARHQYGPTEGADLYGDVTGQPIYTDFLGIGDEAGDLVSFHPFYVRDVLRQSVLDLMTLVRVLDDGDFAGVQAEGGPEFALSDAPIGFVGISLGGIVGTTFVANEPRVGAAVLSVTGGHLSRLVEESASFGPLFLGILLPRLGEAYESVDWDAQPASSLPGTAIFQTLLDRGDSMAHTAALAARPTHLLLHMAKDDETVPNVATESLAHAIGMPMIGGAPVYTGLETATAPLTGNVMVGTMSITRGIVAWEPATHGMLSQRHAETRWQHPPRPPFVAATTTPVENPVDAAQAQMKHFFATWLEGAAEIAE